MQHQVKQYAAGRSTRLVVTVDGDIDTPGTTLPTLIESIQDEINGAMHTDASVGVRPQAWVLTVQSSVDGLPVAANWPNNITLPPGIVAVTTVDPVNGNGNGQAAAQ